MSLDSRLHGAWYAAYPRDPILCRMSIRRSSKCHVKYWNIQGEQVRVTRRKEFVVVTYQSLGKNIKKDTWEGPKSIELVEKTAHRLGTFFGLPNRFHLIQCELLSSASVILELPSWVFSYPTKLNEFTTLLLWSRESNKEGGANEITAFKRITNKVEWCRDEEEKMENVQKIKGVGSVNCEQKKIMVSLCKQKP